MENKTLSIKEMMAALIEEEKESKVSPYQINCSCGKQSPVYTKETDGEQWFSIHECDA